MKFKTGEILFSRGVYALMQESKDFVKFVMYSLSRHKNCDWGDCCPDDVNANDQALMNRSRILSTYKGEENIWIITEWNRKVTTILFPNEY